LQIESQPFNLQGMKKRIIQKEIEKSLSFSPIVGILGSRQVGKTTLAKEIKRNFKNSIYLDLELPSDENKLKEPELFLKNYETGLVVIDEIQRKPELFSVLRALTDQNRKPARFLVLGSSSPDLIKQSSESLAGRIIYHELTPFNVEEIKSENSSVEKLWLRGGYPESFLASTEDISGKWRQAFITTFLERDIPKAGIKIPSAQIRRFWTMLAHAHGSLWNASKLAAALGISPPTSKNYLDILENTFLIRQLQSFFANVKKRLVKAPKIFLRDSGLLHSLLNLNSREDVLGHPVAGHSWEGFVIEQIVNNLPENFGAYFYRTAAGAEIDLVITKADKPLACIEIKFSLSPRITSGFWRGVEDLECKKTFVVYPGKEIFPIKENVSAVPVFLINEFLRKQF